MASITSPKKLSVYERSKLMDGPRVDIYVGPHRKHFRLPKLLLCHYSKFFDRCFNGKFKEGEEQKLDLKDDKVDHFESILQYMLSGSTHDIFNVSDLNDGTAIFKHCFDFIEYTDFYGVGYLNVAVVGPLNEVLRKETEKPFGSVKHIEANHIEIAFRQTPAESPIRTLIVQGVISQENMKVSCFRQQEVEVEGYAAAMLLQLRKCFEEGASRNTKTEQLSWVDPLDGQLRMYTQKAGVVSGFGVCNKRFSK